MLYTDLADVFSLYVHKCPELVCSHIELTRFGSEIKKNPFGDISKNIDENSLSTSALFAIYVKPAIAKR